MKFAKLLFCSLLFLSCTILCNANVQADVVWTETFSQADGAFVNRATETGSGLLDATGNVSIVGGRFQIIPDGGSDRLELESSAAALAGNFAFDVTFDQNGGGSDSLFLQMVDGDSRSTNGAPLPNFAETVDASAFGISTTPVTLNYFFNVTGSDFDYLAPDGSTQTILTGGYDVWIGNTLSFADQTQSGQSGGLPTGGVDTLVLQLFNAQAPSIWTFDNVSFNNLTAVPEPSGIAILSLVFVGFCGRRRRA